MHIVDPPRCGRPCEDAETEVQLVFDMLFGAVYACLTAPRVLFYGGAQY